MNLSGLGVDIVNIKRFDSLSKSRNNKFLLNNFSKKELDYCFSFKDSATHLAGTFAAKEAVFKGLGRKNILLEMVEIRRRKNGRPEVWIKSHKEKSILLSISHTENIALAVAIKK